MTNSVLLCTILEDDPSFRCTILYFIYCFAQVLKVWMCRIYPTINNYYIVFVFHFFLRK